jgi:hypothetical protein
VQTHDEGDVHGRPQESRRYEFRVAGLLSDRTREAFPDMTVVDTPPDTVIVGAVLDDAHLHGVLATILDLGLRVVSVHEVGPGVRAARPSRGDAPPPLPPAAN